MMSNQHYTSSQPFQRSKNSNHKTSDKQALSPLFHPSTIVNSDQPAQTVLKRVGDQLRGKLITLLPTEKNSNASCISNLASTTSRSHVDHAATNECLMFCEDGFPRMESPGIDGRGKSKLRVR